MAYTIEQIAAALGMTAVGAGDIEVEGLAEPADATPRHLALAMKAEFADTLTQGCGPDCGTEHGGGCSDGGCSVCSIASACGTRE